MIRIGEYNKLRINRFTDFGAYLVDDEENEILLPKRYLKEEVVGDEIEAFVYIDPENRPVATTEKPVATVGEFALMKVKAVNKIGAFLDWGLGFKDLLVPFREQKVKMSPGRSYVVYVYLDNNSNRVVASAKLDKFLNNSIPDFYHRQKVDLLITQRTEIGYKVVINNAYWGLIYQNEIYGDVNVGEHHVGYIKQVRDDGKIDVTIAKIEKMRVEDVASAVFTYLENHGGTMQFNDKTDAEEITRTFACSKKDFKKALGLLYREKKITLHPQPTICGKSSE